MVRRQELRDLHPRTFALRLAAQPSGRGPNEQHKLFELRDMYLEELQQSLQQMRPLCWNCHQEERARQATPARLLKGDRQGLSPATE